MELTRDTSLSDVLATFGGNLESVRQLMQFDRAVLDIVVALLEKLEDRTKRAWAAAIGEEEAQQLNPRLEVGKTISVVKNIRDHEGLRRRYEAMINQSLVLLVSYFGSAVRDLFRVAVRRSFREGTNEKLMRAAIKTRVADIRGMDDPADFVADWFTESSELSFQDMKSIGRALGNYFGIDISRGKRENNIILGQACRPFRGARRRSATEASRQREAPGCEARYSVWGANPVLRSRS